MSSTSVISGTGFMKCIPMTWSGRFVAAPSVVIEIDEVFDERMTSAARQAIELREQLLLGLEVLVDGLDHEVGLGEPSSIGGGRDPRASVALARPAGSLPFLDQLARGSCRSSRARGSSALRRTSTSVTSSPDCANTWAMPLPIVPAPTTPTRVISPAIPA